MKQGQGRVRRIRAKEKRERIREEVHPAAEAKTLRLERNVVSFLPLKAATTVGTVGQAMIMLVLRQLADATIVVLRPISRQIALGQGSPRVKGRARVQRMRRLTAIPMPVLRIR